MKILHVCLQAPYTDYWGYQDNLLPKYHKKMGFDVTVLTTNTKFDNGKIVKTEVEEYWLSDGEKVIRRDYKKGGINRIIPFLKIFSISDILNDEEPGVIFVHGLGNVSVLQVAQYLKKNPECKVVADNHVDYYNESPELKKSKIKRRLIITAFKLLNGYMQQFYSKVYGVTPWRVKYEEEIFGIKKEKSDLLVLGADDEKVKYEQRNIIRQQIRLKHGIKENKFLIVTGGKITPEKNIHLLIDAVNNIPDINLIVFGIFDDASSKLIKDGYDSSRIHLIGWIASDKVYDYFLASDLVVFPGTHSVLWEQSCACGIPGVFKHWEGMEHVNAGGNCEFIYNDSSKDIQTIIENILSDRQRYLQMKDIAENKARHNFLYSNIAKKVLEDISI